MVVDPPRCPAFALARVRRCLEPTAGAALTVLGASRGEPHSSVPADRARGAAQRSVTASRLRTRGGSDT